VSDVRWRYDLCESWFAVCAWSKCSAVYRYASTRVNRGATQIGVASPARESDDMVVAKCGRSICGFSQCSVVLHCGLRHGFDKWCMVFMHKR